MEEDELSRVAKKILTVHEQLRNESLFEAEQMKSLCICFLFVLYAFSHQNMHLHIYKTAGCVNYQL